MRLPHLSLIGALVASSAAIAHAAFAHSGATGIVQERMDMMERMGDGMKAMALVLRGEVVFDQATMEQAAAAVREGAEMLPEMFPDGSNDAPSEALDAIWQDWEKFSVIADDMVVNATALEQAVKTGDFVAEFTAVGENCSGCHDLFRKE